MHPYQTTSSSSFSVASNVVDLKHYRTAMRLRSTSMSRSPLRAPERPSADVWLRDDYRERMKVNVVVFVFLMLLITSGVWLLDGLSESFGPERALHHHAQNLGSGPERMVALPAKAADIL